MTTTVPRIDGAGHTASPPQFRLRGRAHQAVLCAHILTSVGWFGIALAVAGAALLASATSDVTLPPVLYRTIQTAPWLSVPVGLASFATGVALGMGTTFGLVRHWWVVAKIAIAGAVVVTDAVLVGRVAHDALVSGRAPTPLFGSTIAHVVMLGVATFLSVFKPRGRTPWGRRRAGADPVSRADAIAAARASVTSQPS
jgi:hypothetical protein